LPYSNLKKKTLNDLRFGDLRLGKYVYKATIEKKDEIEEARIFREIKYQFGNLIITEDIYAPSEKTTDKYILDSNSLLPISRSMFIEIDEVINAKFNTNKVEGQIILKTGVSPFDIKLTSPVLGDGFSLDLILTLIPLQTGYKTELSFFDYRIEDIRKVNVEVSSSENLQTAIGSILCYRVLVSDNENGTFDQYWISSQDYPLIIKSEIGMIYDRKTRMKSIELLEVN